ncbi:MAG TPA: glycosyltransferase family 4 protein [Candidatus Paceibacterota bacterium]|nr:glycosyltransferase family 4 protein [Candidatus Paceibacterota bacterium]
MHRIVLATPLYPPDIGGPATYAKLLAEGLPERGIEVELVKFGDVRHLPKGVRHIAYSWRILRALKRADLALALDPVSVGLPVCIAAWLARKPFTVKIVGDYAWEQGRQRFGITATLDDFVKERRVPLAVWFLRRVQTGVAAYAKHVLVPSRYLEDIVAAWGIPRAKIKVIYNAVPVEAYGAVPWSVAKLPRPLIVTAGRLVPWKHIGGVIDAVAKLRKDGIPVSLAVVGEGPELAGLVHHAEEALKGDYVFTGPLSHADTLATMASARAFVLNSSYEGLSHFLIEALSLGVPTIATAVGGNHEVITDEETGLLVPFGDVAALVAALTRVLSDEDVRARLSARAKESAHRFSTETMLASVARFLEHR